MFDGNTFFGATGMPIEKIARVSTRLADWLPEPFTVAAWNVRSLMVGPDVMAGLEWYDCCPCWRLQPPEPPPYSGKPLNSPLFGGRDGGDPEPDAEPAVVRAQLQLTPEQLGPFAHAGQPIAGARRSGVGRHSVVLDRQLGSVGPPPEPQVDAGRARVAAHVGQRLLGRPVERQTGVGSQVGWLALDRQPRLGAAVVGEPVDQPGEQVRPREVVAPQRPDRPARLVQPLAGQAVRARHGLDGGGRGALPLQQQARALELHGERRQRVAENVVDLA